MNRPRLLFVLLAVTLIAAACGSGGPDLRATVNSVETVGSTSNATALGVDGTGVDAAWSAEGEPKAVADAIAAAAAPDERTDDTSGDVFLLYNSGTVWVSDAEGDGSAVLLYDDNDQAYNRHSVILLRNRSWGTRVNNYRTSRSSSSSGNGFRGGGSSGGK